MSVHTDGADAVRAVMGAEPRTAQPQAPTLPLASSAIFTLDEPQLYDLTYHAVTRYLRNLHGMTLERAHTHAARIASTAVVNALASDQCTRGEPSC